MGFTRNKGYFCVGQCRADKRSSVILFVKIGKNKPLPVEVEKVFGESCVKDQTRALGLRLKQKLNLGIMAKRFKMSYANCLICNLFFV